MLELTNDALTAVWKEFQDAEFDRESTWSKITAERVAELLGAAGELYETGDTYLRYRRYASDDGSLTVTFEKETGNFLNSSLNAYGRP